MATRKTLTLQEQVALELYKTLLEQYKNNDALLLTQVVKHTKLFTDKFMEKE